MSQKSSSGRSLRRGLRSTWATTRQRRRSPGRRRRFGLGRREEVMEIGCQRLVAPGHPVPWPFSGFLVVLVCCGCVLLFRPLKVSHFKKNLRTAQKEIPWMGASLNVPSLDFQKWWFCWNLPVNCTLDGVSFFGNPLWGFKRNQNATSCGGSPQYLVLKGNRK